MKLDLTWFAIFKNGEILRQFDGENQTRERLFKEIQERANDLRGFQLVNVRTKVSYTVDLVSGRLRIAPPIGERAPDGVTQNPEIETRGNDRYKYRLIYFRRVTQEMTAGGTQLSQPKLKDIQYFLGFQYTNEKGENVKRLLQIAKNDEVYIA